MVVRPVWRPDPVAMESIERFAQPSDLAHVSPSLNLTARGESLAAFDGRCIPLHPNAAAALGTPAWLRCSSLKYSRYSRSSRLAIGAPRPSRCDARLSPRAVSRRGRRERRETFPCALRYESTATTKTRRATKVTEKGNQEKTRNSQKPRTRKNGFTQRRAETECLRQRQRERAWSSERSPRYDSSSRRDARRPNVIPLPP